MNESIYKEIVKKNTPKKKIFKNILLAFLSGGTLALIAEFVKNICINYFSLSKDDASLLGTLSIIFLSVILTFIGYYNNVAQLAGAGSFLPTTGFANSLTSSAMEGRSEGLITGIGSMIFSLAGSVITTSIFISFYFLTIYYLLSLMGINVWA